MKTKFEIHDLEIELNTMFQDLTSWNENELKESINIEREINKCEQLNDPVHATPISKYAEDNVQDLGDWLCKAALFEEEEQEYEPEVEVGDYVYTHSDFIPTEQKESNFKFYMKKLLAANNFGKLKAVRETVLIGQQGKNGQYFFPVGKSKEFWAAYNAKKEQLNQVTKIKKTLYKQGA